MTELERLNNALKFIFLKIGIYKKADMADFLGYRSPYFSGIINGKEKMTEQFLKNISDKLDINIDYVLEGKGEMIMNKQKSENNSATGIIGNNVNGGGINGHRIIQEMIELLKKKDEQMDSLIETNKKLTDKLINI